MLHAVRTGRLVVILVAAVLVSVWVAPTADAGGGPPRANAFDFEAAYINCVDDEVDEPGIDGDALVRVRLTNNSAEDVVVDGGSWRLVADAVTLADGEFITPAALSVGATWEQVVRIPGDTGPAFFAATVDVTGAGGTATFFTEPALGVPGDCAQPEADTTSTDPIPQVVDDAVLTAPRFTG